MTTIKNLLRMCTLVGLLVLLAVLGYSMFFLSLEEQLAIYPNLLKGYFSMMMIYVMMLLIP